MFETIKNAWKIAELRQKILFTIFIVAIFRIGAVIPVPFINVNALGQGIASESNAFFSYLSVLTGGGLEYGSIFAMSVTPYINASIIIQLLSVAIPYLERLSKEGQEGQKKIAQITRYVTVAIGLVQGFSFYMYLKSYNFVTRVGGAGGIFAGFVIVLCLTAGSALVMWLGEQIDAKGIGNGISILLFAGIISRAPQAFNALTMWWSLPNGPLMVILIVAAFLLMVAFVVWMTNAERKIPVQYAKRVVGRKMYGGQNSHIPIKVNMSGVMPIIFASSILMLPTMILGFMGNNNESWFFKALSVFSVQGPFYAILYLVLIIAFAYFYVTIQYNTVEMANNLRKNSGAIPGIRPGKPTSDFLKGIISRITLMGALFLSVVAVLPIVLSFFNSAFASISIGGTSVLIVVGVALEVVQNLESQMMMRHYKSFLD